MQSFRIRFSFVVLFCLILLTGLGARLGGYNPELTLAERLGYPSESKLLLVHADDLGLAHSVNRATFRGLESGLVTSASVMVPCPWLEEVAHYAAKHPEADLGIHLTLNSEWELYKWGPVAPFEKVSSLVDARGYLHASTQETVSRADPAEVEVELRAQVQRAMDLGVKPTHLDTHMGTVLYSPEFFKIYLKLGREIGIPVFLVKAVLGMAPYARDLIQPGDVAIDHFLMMQTGVEPDRWPEVYGQMIQNLKPGVTQLIVHLGFDDEEMRGVAFNHPDFGAAWRQRDFDFVTSEHFSKLLKDHDVQLITWKDLGKLNH